ncbi:MAG: hypothetical protein LBD93_01585 [Treponema sp.]|jgi:hypothetical protein|nr:hypothetical protein [Treponema sp.]
MDRVAETPGVGKGKPSYRLIQDEARGMLVLEFDTGLDAHAFAQLKLAHLSTTSGYVVSPVGSWAPWKPIGVREQQGTMRIWGPAFTGEGLDMLITDERRKDWALDALRYWIRAWLFLETQQGLPTPVLGPAGALVAPSGKILFPPKELLRYSLKAGGEDAWLKGVEGYVHPDLPGLEGLAFTAGAILYRICCGAPSFSNTNLEILHKDIREGIFLPPGLAVPGLDAHLATLINQALSPLRGQQGAWVPLGLSVLAEALGPPGFAPLASYLHEVNPEEQARITRERARFIKQHTLQVQVKRFIHRNAMLVAGIAIAVLSVALIIKSVIADRGKRPSTHGMEPQAVVETYYEAMGDLDHLLMDACVMAKVGKDDIAMVTNFFVISRVRQAYEREVPVILSAQEWLDAGAPPTEATVFGVSDLHLEGIDQDEADGEVSFAASYLLWLPGSFRNPEGPTPRGGDAKATEETPFPWSISRRDFMRLIQYQGTWRIAEIQRSP